MSDDLRPGPSTLMERAMFFIVRNAFYGFSKLFWRASLSGIENVPRTGGYIVAPVHRSNIDGLPMVAMTKRRLCFLGKDSLWKNPISAWFFTTMGGYAVSRGTADREALRRCVEVVERGEPLVLFPEGTRQRGPIVQELFEGAAYVASRTGVPIVPVGIGGSEAAMPKGAKMIRPVKVHIEIGAPIPAPAGADGGRAPRSALHETTALLHEELQRLFDIAQAKAGRPNPPQ